MIRSSRMLPHKKQRLAVKREVRELIDHEWKVTAVLLPDPVFASSRPLMWKEQRLLPEGAVSDDFRVINCNEQLLVADDKAGTTGDIIANHLGSDWRVIAVTPWGAGNRHNSYKIQKIGPAQ